MEEKCLERTIAGAFVKGTGVIAGGGGGRASDNFNERFCSVVMSRASDLAAFGVVLHLIEMSKVSGCECMCAHPCE